MSATAGFRGALQRLAGGSPEGPSWALRVTSILTGGSGLVRSRSVWEGYAKRVEQEVRAMVDAKSTDGTLYGALSGPRPEGRLAAQGRATGLEVTMSEAGPTVVPDFLVSVAEGDHPPPAPAPRGERHDVGHWRAFTQEAIAQAEDDERRLLKQAESLRQRARDRQKEAGQLRRALALVGGRPAPAPGVQGDGQGTLRGRILEWIQAHDGELVVAGCAAETGLSVKRVSDVASQAYREGRLERLGKGHYRLAPTHAEEQAG